MAANNTDAYRAQENQSFRNVVLLAAATRERTFYLVGGETEAFYAQLETDLTARVANDTARLAHFDAFETN